jgi:general stress protein 26
MVRWQGKKPCACCRHETMILARTALLVSMLVPSLVIAQKAPTRKPSRTEIIKAARDVIQKAVYCTFITIGEDGQPQARIVEPTLPDSDLNVWIGTNPLTRKVKQIQRDARVTLLCFHAASSSYVTVLGRAAVVTDAGEKERRWKTSWAPFYPNGFRDSRFTLIRVTPTRLEISSPSRKMMSDPKTWLPVVIDFP